jgi:hypothetical protein
MGFLEIGSHNYYLPQALNLLISALPVARIISMSHQHLVLVPIFDSGFFFLTGL